MIPIFIIDDKDFQDELSNAKLLSELNQNITLNLVICRNFQNRYKVELLARIELKEKMIGYLCLLIDLILLIEL